MDLIKNKTLQLYTIKKIFLAAVIYSLATIPGKLLLMLLPGAEVRFAACLPVVFGMLWGLPGAIGITLGNIISDIYSNESIRTCLLGGISNFILAYLPYRLWYGWNSKDAALFIYNTKSCLRFFLINLITIFNFAALLAAIIILDFNSDPLHSFSIFFSSNFDFTLLFGIPLLLYFRKNNWQFSMPTQKQYAVKGNSKLPLAALLLSTLSSIGFLIAVHYDLAAYPVPLLFLTSNLILLLFSCTLPASYEENATDTDAPKFYSIGAKATMVTLLLAIVTIIFIIILSVFTHRNILSELRSLMFWQETFSLLLISINFVFLAVLIILYQLEKSIVNPISNLSKQARDFVDNNYLDDTPQAFAIDKADPNDEIEELYQSFGKMTVDLQTYITNWQNVTKEKEAIAAQLAVGAQIQQSILPDAAKLNQRLKGYEIKAGMYPAKEVGGDLYDCFLIDKDKLAILIADVSGKGIPAALFMMVTKTLLQSKSHLQNPAAILAEVNNALAENNDNMMFVTVWLGIIELSTGKITYANAGHNYPLLEQSDGSIIWLKEKSGPALGIIPNKVYKNYEQQLLPEGKLLLYTDGISEAENSRHEFYGTERLEARFRRAHIPEDILFSIQEFAEGTPPSDDITLLWVQRK